MSKVSMLAIAGAMKTVDNLDRGQHAGLLDEITTCQPYLVDIADSLAEKGHPPKNVDVMRKLIVYTAILLAIISLLAMLGIWLL